MTLYGISLQTESCLVDVPLDIFKNLLLTRHVQRAV